MSDEQDRHGSIGQRVRAARKLTGLTQHQLADRAHVSLSLVKAVEQGRAPASPGFTSAAARALGADTATLLDQPPPLPSRRDREIHSVIPALRGELAAFRLEPEYPAAPRSVDNLAAAVAQASRLRHAATLDSLGAELPALLAELRAATYTHDGAERERVYRLLAETYYASNQVCWKLGYGDLAALAVERVDWAAEQSGDPLTVAMADFLRAGPLMMGAEWCSVARFLEQARGRIADQVATGDEAALALHGMLHLDSALGAARSGNADTSDDHLGEARHAAQHVTRGSDYYRFAFDTDNVNIWAVGLAVERADGTEAVKRADGLRFSRTAPRERVGHHWIDLARGYQLHGDREGCLDALNRARRVTPQQTRYHPQVRETVLTLAEQDRRRTDSLAGFARWAGIEL